jgi:hypothetical protein
MKVSKAVVRATAKDILPVSKAEIDTDRSLLAGAIDRDDIVSAYKINFSGLSSWSNGSVDESCSVYHGLCLKDLTMGAIKRSANSFICGAKTVNYGYVVSPASTLSCPRCVDIAQKYRLSLSDDLTLEVL